MAETRQRTAGFRTPASRCPRRCACVSEAVINRDDTTQIIRLFDEGLPALHEVEVFTTPAFDRLIAPKPPSVKGSRFVHQGNATV